MTEIFTYLAKRVTASQPPLIGAAGLVLAVAWCGASTPGFAQSFDKSKIFNSRLGKAAQQAPRTAGNGFYKVVIEDFVGAGVGLYSVCTGPQHPVTDRLGVQDLLAGASRNLTGTSYTTVRSFSNGIDYVQTDFASNPPDGFDTFLLDNIFTDGDSVVPSDSFIQPIPRDGPPTGFEVSYSLPGLARQIGRVFPRDTLDITQIVNVHGREFKDSWVEITTIVKNTGTRAVTIGIRYLWDLNIAGDDGPILKQYAGDPFGPNEAELSPVDFAFYQAQANDSISVSPPAYHVFGSALTPASLRRAPLQPGLLQQAFWPQAFFNAFDYQTDATIRVIGGQDDPLSRLTGGDNAVLYYWRETAQGHAITLWPGQSAEVTQGLFGCLPNDPPEPIDWTPPMCEVMSVQPGPPKTIEVMVLDFESGLGSVRVRDDVNVHVHIPDFETGTTEPVHITATAIDNSQPFQFTIVARDLAGNVSTCDPILLTLQADGVQREFRLQPVAADRYFYLDNRGIEQIEIELNGHAFALRTQDVSGKNVFKMPARGDMTIDIMKYLKPDRNDMILAFSGPAGSRAEVILADMNMKAGVDLVLNLEAVPRQFGLAQNLPNPFRGRTTITFELPESRRDKQPVKLTVFNMLGQVVRTLVDERLASDRHTVQWDGLDNAGREAAAGIYIYRLTAGGTQLTKKMALLR